MRPKKYLLSAKAILLLAFVMGFALLSGGMLLFAAAEDEPGPDLAQTGLLEDELPHALIADLNDVFLISGDVLEIEYNAPVSAAEAKALFDIRVDGTPVAWEFLSYFDFGAYAARGGVVNVRLAEPLDAGEPRGRRRESAAESYLARTEHILGPIAAASVTVSLSTGAPKTAKWDPFYMERSLGNMSRLWTYASAKAGNNGTQLLLANPNNYTSNNIFSATADPLYTDEYIVRQVGEGMNRFVGRSEYMNLPMIDSGFKALFVGPSQSVYEAPEYRELYEYGVTTDTFSRPSIKATDVPGNFDPLTGEFKKPFIVGTSDDVLRHDSPLKAADGISSARPKSDFFYFGEAFFDMYWELGMVQGCPRFPLSHFNTWDDYRYDLHVIEAYEKAKAAGLWPGTKMMESVKNYYVYGVMTFWELVPESQKFEYMSWPVNTRAEIYEYDYPLYWALSGAHGKYEYWTGYGTAQGLTSRSDANKLNTPWFWWNQPDNFGLPAAGDPTMGEAYPPLAIESVTIISHNLVEIKFNREVKTLAAVTNAANWRIYIGDRQLSGISDYHGYGWKSIRLNTGNAVNFATGLSTSNAQNRLDNGKPYGRFFCGFTQTDIDERKVSAGGWISNSQQAGANPLRFGQFISLDDAIAMGAGPTEDGVVRVEYVGGASAAPQVLDWDGNELAKGLKYEADFRPWMGHVYRTPLTGYYIYLDTNVASRDFYMYTRKGLASNITVKDVAMAAANKYETQFANNKTVTYPRSAGGDAFDHAFAVGSGSRTTTHAGAGMTSTYTWNNGTITYSSQNITNGPVTYDRVGQRIADGAVRGNGGMLIAAGSVLGNHPGRQPQSTGLASGVADGLRVEGWGGNVFQTEDVLIVRDYNLCRYKNESLVWHEGGHGIDSFANGASNYAQNIYNDITTAWATAVSYASGAKYHDVDGIGAYMSVRGEYVSTWGPWYAGGGRESFQGINDGTWTPIATREEAFRYDPWGGEVFKRVFFTGDLGLWYEGKIGDPKYRVLVEDWELLRDQNPAFSHWTSENDLVAWGFSTPPTALDNPYAGTTNPLIRWVSWNSPSVWNPEPYREPSNPSFPNNRFDFVGRSAYHPEPDGKSPIKVETHPFLVAGGVKKPERPAEMEALVKPATGKIAALSLKTPVVVQFGYEGDLPTTNNVPTSFELRVDGKLQAIYFYSYKDGIAQLRLDWPIEDYKKIDLTVLSTGQTIHLAKPLIVVDHVGAAPGSNVDVTYNIAYNELGFTTLDLELPYDSSIYKPVAVTPSAALNDTAGGNYFFANPSFNGSDILKIAFASSDKVIGDGLLFTVTYEVKAGLIAEDAPLDVEVLAARVDTGSADLENIDLLVRPGWLSIGLLGDVDGNGKITPEDAMVLLQMYVGLIPWTPRALIMGDVNKDGVVDTTDAALILRMVVGG
ncbi:MAG: dockerin type I domain-containing protein [Clostridiales bacterium]|nr:dockerin type I domain-containing protein [Clostridiales bacterium]